MTEPLRRDGTRPRCSIVRVQPRASRTEFASSLRATACKVRLQAPPVDGRANAGAGGVPCRRRSDVPQRPACKHRCTGSDRSRQARATARRAAGSCCTARLKSRSLGLRMTRLSQVGPWLGHPVTHTTNLDVIVSRARLRRAPALRHPRAKFGTNLQCPLQTPGFAVLVSVAARRLHAQRVHAGRGRPADSWQGAAQTSVSRRKPPARREAHAPGYSKTRSRCTTTLCAPTNSTPEVARAYGIERSANTRDAERLAARARTPDGAATTPIDGTVSAPPRTT